MMHLLIVLFIQSGIAVLPVNTRLEGPYTKAECTAKARTEDRVLTPTGGEDGRWQVTRCLEILSIPEPVPITDWNNLYG